MLYNKVLKNILTQEGKNRVYCYMREIWSPKHVTQPMEI
jgi:hypothetical protein